MNQVQEIENGVEPEVNTENGEKRARVPMDQLKALRRDGLSVTEAANELGISYQTIYQAVRRLEGKKKKARGKKKAAVRAKRGPGRPRKSKANGAQRGRPKKKAASRRRNGGMQDIVRDLEFHFTAIKTSLERAGLNVDFGGGIQVDNIPIDSVRARFFGGETLPYIAESLGVDANALAQRVFAED